MLLLLAACASGPGEVELLALAASSLADVLPAAASAYEAQGGATVTVSLGSSSALARQIEAGVPADLVLLADLPTLDGIDGLLVPGSRREVAGNALVAVVPAASTFTPTGPAELVRAEHLALAGENVPAGRYARAALEEVWTAVEDRVVTGDDVRTTLAWVARGEADAGVVYATDARVEPAVRVAFVFPPDSHPPIVYPAAVLAGSAHREEAARFLAFLGSDEGRRIFLDAGFR